MGLILDVNLEAPASMLLEMYQITGPALEREALVWLFSAVLD